MGSNPVASILLGNGSPLSRTRAIVRAGIAQPVEHFTRNEGVVSSNLISSCTLNMGVYFRGVAQFGRAPC